MSGDFSTALARASGPVPADGPTGGSSWEGALAPAAAAFVSAVWPEAPPVRPPVVCDNASPGQSHIRHIESPTTVPPAVIFIFSTRLVVHSRPCQQKLEADKIDCVKRLEREPPRPTYFGQRRRLGHIDGRRHVDPQDLVDRRLVVHQQQHAA